MVNKVTRRKNGERKRLSNEKGTDEFLRNEKVQSKINARRKVRDEKVQN